ncbi:Hypothetical predicted protein [Olea europaea subsp. europaea]|uniref:Uncharacterized protein n=1 Tax=Olea europaea subsp. europaea TaxID=158383 RepID=A0A8S0UEE0_OLEEU|nr:Hypothetical predicted protein [Olea europaea subsp. europaea]
MGSVKTQGVGTSSKSLEIIEPKEEKIGTPSHCITRWSWTISVLSNSKEKGIRPLYVSDVQFNTESPRKMNLKRPMEASITDPFKTVCGIKLYPKGPHDSSSLKKEGRAHIRATGDYMHCNIWYATPGSLVSIMSSFRS